MARFSVRVDGLTEARDTIASLPEAFKQQARESIDIGSRIILSEAARRVPVLSGKLKQSLGRNVREDGLEAAVGSGDPKARFVHFGTEDTPAVDFLYTPFRLGSKYVRATMRNWAEKAGEQAKFKTKRGRKS